MPEDPSDLISLDTSRIPVLVTLTKIGANYVVDATEKEEAASVSSYVLAIDPEDEIIHSRKMGAGTLFMQPLKSNWEVSNALPLSHALIINDLVAVRKEACCYFA